MSASLDLSADPSSSNGQTYTGDGDDKYVTSVFSFTCKGRLTAGIVGGSEFHFALTDDQHVVVTSGSASKTKRDIPVPDGFYVIPATIPGAPPGERCPAGQSAVSNGLAPSANGCGAKDGIKVPNLSFGQCCDDHDICFGTCSEQFGPCNSRFLGCMTQSCVKFAPVPKLFLACNGAAASYYLAVQFFGKGAFAAATKELCDCKCEDKTKTACGDKCVDTSTDPENCGSCYFHVSSLYSTVMGDCFSNTCVLLTVPLWIVHQRRVLFQLLHGQRLRRIWPLRPGRKLRVRLHYWRPGLLRQRPDPVQWSGRLRHQRRLSPGQCVCCRNLLPAQCLHHDGRLWWVPEAAEAWLAECHDWRADKMGGQLLNTVACSTLVYYLLYL